MANRVLFVTGVSGFLGRWIAAVGAREGWNVHGVDLVPPENAPRLESYRQISITDDEIGRMLASIRPTLCVHCAGRASVGLSILDPRIDFESGPYMALRMLEYVRLSDSGCPFILLSSAAVYGEPLTLPVSECDNPKPISPYGFHKWQSEILCQEYANVYGIPTAAVRIFSAYGAGLRRQVLWDICQKALTSDSVTLHGTGDESRDFVHSADVAAAIFAISQNGSLRGEVYNVANGEEVRINDVAHRICQLLNRKIPIRNDGRRPSGDPGNWRAETSRIRRLGFNPQVSFDAGVENYVRWARAEIQGF